MLLIEKFILATNENIIDHEFFKAQSFYNQNIMFLMITVPVYGNTNVQFTNIIDYEFFSNHVIRKN